MFSFALSTKLSNTISPVALVCFLEGVVIVVVVVVVLDDKFVLDVFYVVFNRL